MYTIYTDGAYSSSRNTGGYSAIIVHEGNVVKKLYQGYKNTTNNRMELLGVLAALKYFDTPETLEIYSDSQYVVNSINQKWLFKWIEEQDLTKKNLDLWFEIADLLKFHNVVMHWVKGHADDYYNNLADIYAVHAGQCLNLPIDKCTESQLKESETTDTQTFNMISLEI